MPFFIKPKVSLLRSSSVMHLAGVVDMFVPLNLKQNKTTTKVKQQFSVFLLFLLLFLVFFF